MSVKQRLKEYVSYKKLSDRQFSLSIGVSAGYINSISKSIQPDKLNSISVQYPDLNTDWLLTGNGEMLKNSDKKSIRIENNQYKLVPLYNLDAVGGSNNDIVDVKAYISEYIPFRDAKETDICIPVSGKSMMPTYSPGTIILVRQIHDWLSYTELGQIYVLILKDGRRLLKEVKRSEENARDNFLLYSHNPEFQPTEIPKSIIADMYLVMALYQKTTM